MPCSPNLVAVLGLPLLLGGCPRPPIDFGPAGEIRSADELLRRVEVAELAVDRVKGEGSLFVDTPDGKGSTGAFVAAQGPASVHVEQLDFFGRPQRVLVTDGHRFGLYEADGPRYLEGAATPGNLARLLPFEIDVAVLAGAVLGRVPRLLDATAELALDPERRAYRVTLTAAGARQVLWIDPRWYRVVRAELPGVTVEFLDLGPVPEGSFYRRVRMTDRGAVLELTWADVVVNGPEEPQLFSLGPPPGVPRQEVAP